MPHRGPRRITSLLFTLAALVFTALPPAAAHTAESLFRSIRAPGVAIIHFNDKGISREYYFGTDGDGAPITRDTVFTWGSLSASLTAATALELHHQGELNVRTPVAELLPQLEGSQLDRNKVTVTHLIHHTAGLPTNLERGQPTTQGLVDATAQLTDLPTPGTHSYSNVGYSLLQAIIEDTTGQPINAALNNTVGESSQAGPIIADLKAFQKRVPKGHQRLFHSNLPVRVEPWQSAIGAAFLAGSCEQFAHYGTWQLRQHRTHNTPSNFERAIVSSTKKYGPGLYYETAQKRDGTETQYIYHTGSVWGYSSYLGFVPEDNRGLIILTNEYGLRTQYDEHRRNEIHTYINAYFQFNKNERASIFPTDIVVLSVETLIVLLLLGGIVRSTLKFRTPNPPSDARDAFKRTTVPLLLGIGGALTIYYGTPIVTDCNCDELSVGAPDISGLFWTILVQIHVLTGIVVLRETLWSRTCRGADKQ